MITRQRVRRKQLRQIRGADKLLMRAVPDIFCFCCQKVQQMGESHSVVRGQRCGRIEVDDTIDTTRCCADIRQPTRQPVMNNNRSINAVKALNEV